MLHIFSKTRAFSLNGVKRVACADGQNQILHPQTTDKKNKVFDYQSKFKKIPNKSLNFTDLAIMSMNLFTLNCLIVCVKFDVIKTKIRIHMHYDI